MTPSADGWLIVKTEAGNCEILPVEEITTERRAQAQTWGPYPSQGEAIAKRVGLIRSGQCDPT